MNSKWHCDAILSLSLVERLCSATPDHAQTRCVILSRICGRGKSSDKLFHKESRDHAKRRTQRSLNGKPSDSRRRAASQLPRSPASQALWARLSIEWLLFLKLPADTARKKPQRKLDHIQFPLAELDVNRPSCGSVVHECAAGDVDGGGSHGASLI